MIIRDKQIEVFQDIAENSFTEEVANHIITNHPDASFELPPEIMASVVIEGNENLEEDVTAELPDELFFMMVESGISKARSYGLTWRSSITAFVTLMFVIAPNFDEQPLIKEVLTNEKLPSNERINLLPGLTRVQDWDEALANYDSNAWKIKLD